MTIAQLMDGVKKNWIEVLVLEKITETQYIVGDGSGLAIMQISDETDHAANIQVGKNLKLVKPTVKPPDVIINDKRFSPMKCKSKPITCVQDQNRVDYLKSLANKLPVGNDVSIDEMQKTTRKINQSLRCFST